MFNSRSFTWLTLSCYSAIAVLSIYLFVLAKDEIVESAQYDLVQVAQQVAANASHFIENSPPASTASEANNQTLQLQAFLKLIQTANTAPLIIFSRGAEVLAYSGNLALSAELHNSALLQAENPGSPWLQTQTNGDFLTARAQLPGQPALQVILFKHKSAIPLSLLLGSAGSLGLVSLLLFLALAGWLTLRAYARKPPFESATAEGLKQLIKISSEPILIHNQGQIIDANEPAIALLGYDKESFNNLLVWDLLAPESLSKAQSHYKDDYELPYEVIAIRKDGSRIPIEISAKSAQANGRAHRIMSMRDISERKEHERRIMEHNQYDALTGLPNRNLMLDRLDQALKKSHRYGQRTVVMFIDIDDFKKINDSLGHTLGDQLLVAAGQRILETTREGDTLARYGGDEFILILEDVKNLNDVEAVANKALGALEKVFKINEQSLYVSGSIGISVYPDDGDNCDILLQKADTAMYCSKDNGHNGYYFYTPAMNALIKQQVELEHELRSALEHQEFTLNYQPVFCTRSGKLLSAEALIRWYNPALGQITPDEFIPVAEQTGLIVAIGEWVINEVCSQTKKWLDLGMTDFRTSINISPRQFRDKRLMTVLDVALARTGLPAEALCIEITEGLLVKDDEQTAITLQRLKELGVHLSLDDFGTGYSALSYLKRFPFDNLKIDRSFIRDLADDHSDRQLVQATIAMSEGLGLNVIAEGVETKTQLDFLKDQNCFAVQGFLMGKPMATHTFTELIIKPAIKQAQTEAENAQSINTPTSA